MFRLNQRRSAFSTGYVEVKPGKSHAKSRETYKDTLRLVNFCKDTIDKQNVALMIAVQAAVNLWSKYLFLYVFNFFFS